MTYFQPGKLEVMDLQRTRFVDLYLTHLIQRRVGNEQSEPSDEHDLMSRAERDVFLLVAHE
jgi:hypothetical protein